MKLRVCHMIAGDQWAGAEVQTAHLLSGLARRKDLELSAVLFSEGLLAKDLRRSGVSVAVLDEGKLGRFGLLREIANVLRAHRVQILHTHRYKENILGAVSGRRAGVRCYVRTEHGHVEPFTGVDRIKMCVYQTIDQFVARLWTNRIIAVSPDLFRAMAGNHPQGRLVLILNGIDTERIRPTVPPVMLRQELGLKAHGPVFGTAGRLVPVKGLPYFLEAARIILEKLPAACFLIVGDGPLRSSLEQSVRDLGIGHAVHFVGFRPDILDILSVMDVFVLPSLSEGLSMVLLEAMALGKPIVSSSVGGTPEVLRDACGWLVPPRDHHALAEACMAAIAQAHNSKSMGIVDRRRVQLRALCAAMCDQTHVLYQALMQQPCRATA